MGFGGLWPAARVSVGATRYARADVASRWPEGAAENRSATTRKDFGKAWLWEQFALFLETQKPGVSPSAHHIHVEAHAGEDREIASLFGSVGSPAADGRAV